MSEDNIRYDQVNIICAEDCGNAPKKELLRAFNVAFVCNDIGFITEHIIEDIQWNFIGFFIESVDSVLTRSSYK